MEISEVFDTATGFIAVAALIALALLLPLYLSQRRDVRRMRDWMQREPEHPVADLAASEAILDRAEAELEELTAEPPTAVTPATGVTPTTPVPAATRVTHERPALERITMERAALEPHPRWRRFAGRATQPRALIAIGILALLLGGAAIFVSEELLKQGGGPQGRRAGAIEPGEVSVAVLNGTAVTGLASKVGSEIEASGYEHSVTTKTAPGFAKTVVQYADGQKFAAQKVARDLGVEENQVERLDRESRRLAEGAEVVVIVGEDFAP